MAVATRSRLFVKRAFWEDALRRKLGVTLNVSSLWSSKTRPRQPRQPRRPRPKAFLDSLNDIALLGVRPLQEGSSDGWLQENQGSLEIARSKSCWMMSG